MNRNASPRAIRFHMALDADKYLAYYKGKAKYILVRSLDNRSIKFPASAIRGFLTREGVYGLFEIQFDENNKLINIVRIN